MASDQHTLIDLIKRYPPLWDRNHEKFRDREFKTMLWTEIGKELALTGAHCKEIFKGLREKYIREREKQNYGNYRPWEFLDQLQFLDPYIITRKPHSWNPTSDEIFIKQDPSEFDHSYHDKIGVNVNDSNDPKAAYWSKEYCKALIKMVHESSALWDRQSKDYHDKQLKDHLWQAMARTLGCNVNNCTLRWKALREKYIRQKQKFLEGESKWEFLDDLSFLDNVIQYRKKWQSDEQTNAYGASDNSSMQSQTPSDYEIVDEHTNDSTPNHPTSSSYQSPIFSGSIKRNTPDSTLDISKELEMRKRKASDASEISYKKQKLHAQDRTPVQIFGELVAAMLAFKPENERNAAMMEIMSVLAKPSAAKVPHSSGLS